MAKGQGSKQLVQLGGQHGPDAVGCGDRHVAAIPQEQQQYPTTLVRLQNQTDGIIAIISYRLN